MPYSVDHKNKCVYKKKQDGSRGEKVGCTKGDLKAYLAKLHMIEPSKNMKKENKITLGKAILRLPATKLIKESVRGLQPVDDLQFWVVLKPKSYESNIKDICTEVTPFQFNQMCGAGLSPDQVHGFYIDEPEAQSTAKQLLVDLQDKALALEAKKEEVTAALQKKMNELQKLAEMHMKAMKSEPDKAGEHHVKAESYLSKLKELRDKHKMVEEAKKQIAKRDYDKDGEIETPEEEYKGVKDKAIKQSQNKKK